MDPKERFLVEIGPQARGELLAALTTPEEERAARIGRLSSRTDAQLVAELLTELEGNEPARLQFIATLCEMRGAVAPYPERAVSARAAAQSGTFKPLYARDRPQTPTSGESSRRACNPSGFCLVQHVR